MVGIGLTVTAQFTSIWQAFIYEYNSIKNVLDRYKAFSDIKFKSYQGFNLKKSFIAIEL